MTRMRALLAALLLALVGMTALAAPAGAAEDLAEECIEILEGGGEVDECQEAPSPIVPELAELVWGTLAFLIILGALAKFGLPAVRKGMDARTEKIRDSLEEAEKAKTEAEAVKADYQRQLADARSEAGRIVEEARQQADALKKNLATQAEAEAEDARRRNAEQLEGERVRVLGELRGQVATLAVDAAERVVKASLDRDTSRRLVEDYIDSVGAGSGNGRSTS